jgi:carboxylesterase type B
VRNPDAPVHEAQFSDFLAELSVPESLPKSEIFTHLRSLPTAAIARAQTAVFSKYNPSLRWAFQPVIDREIIRGRPTDAWRSGRWHKMPIMTGFQGNEGSLYVDKKMSTSGEFSNFWRTLLPQLSEEDVQSIEGLYPEQMYRETRQELGVGNMYKRIEASYAHYAYVAPVRQTARYASQDVPVYLYHWALRRDVVDGAKHGDNMLFEVRDPKLRKLGKSIDEMSGLLHAYTTSFICTGSPNKLSGAYSQRLEWTAYKRDDAKVMIFGKDSDEFIGGTCVGEPAVMVEDEFARRESEFWWSKVELSQQ